MHVELIGWWNSNLKTNKISINSKTNCLPGGIQKTTTSQQTQTQQHTAENWLIGHEEFI